MAVPTTTLVAPNNGPAAGGTAITLTGTGYTGTTGVTVGGTAATSVVVVSDTDLTCVTPAHAAGSAAIVVTNGTGASTVNVNFTFDVAPVVTSLDVATGGLGGDDEVHLTGTGFSTVTAVHFGSTAAERFTIDSATEITAFSPAASAGATNITVISPQGTSATASGNVFTYGTTTVEDYVQPDGDYNFDQYVEDIAITPANLASGALFRRLDPVVYPQKGVINAPKQGTAGSPFTAPAPANNQAN